MIRENSREMREGHREFRRSLKEQGVEFRQLMKERDAEYDRMRKELNRKIGNLMQMVMYIIVQSGEAVEIVQTPEGFKTKEW